VEEDEEDEEDDDDVSPPAVVPVAGVPVQDLVDVIDALRLASVGLTLARGEP
jgi:hypothetical protein